MSRFLFSLILKLRIYKGLFTKSIKNLFPLELIKKNLQEINSQAKINSL